MTSPCGMDDAVGCLEVRSAYTMEEQELFCAACQLRREQGISFSTPAVRDSGKRTACFALSPPCEASAREFEDSLAGALLDNKVSPKNARSTLNDSAPCCPEPPVGRAKRNKGLKKPQKHNMQYAPDCVVAEYGCIRISMYIGQKFKLKRFKLIEVCPRTDNMFTLCFNDLGSTTIRPRNLYVAGNYRVSIKDLIRNKKIIPGDYKLKNVNTSVNGRPILIATLVL